MPQRSVGTLTTLLRVAAASARLARGAALTSVASALAIASPTIAESESTLLRIAGSDSMGPFLEKIGHELAATSPTLRVEVDDRGSSTGPPALLRGEATIASMTRPMNDVENAAFEARTGRPAEAFAIAVDAVALYVNAENPLEQMTLAQIDAVFSTSQRCGGARQPIKLWGELGLEDDWADRKIGVYATPPASGTRALFRQVALCGGRIREAREQPGTRSLAIAVAESRYGIGIGTLAGASPEIRSLALPARDGDGWATPQETDIRSGRYPFGRRLFLYVKRDEKGHLHESVAAFLRFTLSDAGQRVIAEAAFLPLETSQTLEQLSRLD